jgi:hypothetical protein
MRGGWWKGKGITDAEPPLLKLPMEEVVRRERLDSTESSER